MLNEMWDYLISPFNRIFSTFAAGSSNQNNIRRRPLTEDGEDSVVGQSGSVNLVRSGSGLNGRASHSNNAPPPKRSRFSPISDNGYNRYAEHWVRQEKDDRETGSISNHSGIRDFLNMSRKFQSGPTSCNNNNNTSGKGNGSVVLDDTERMINGDLLPCKGGDEMAVNGGNHVIDEMDDNGGQSMNKNNNYESGYVIDLTTREGSTAENPIQIDFDGGRRCSSEESNSIIVEESAVVQPPISNNIPSTRPPAASSRKSFPHDHHSHPSTSCYQTPSTSTSVIPSNTTPFSSRLSRPPVSDLSGAATWLTANGSALKSERILSAHRHNKSSTASQGIKLKEKIRFQQILQMHPTPSNYFTPRRNAGEADRRNYFRYEGVERDQNDSLHDLQTIKDILNEIDPASSAKTPSTSVDRASHHAQQSDKEAKDVITLSDSPSVSPPAIVPSKVKKTWPEIRQNLDLNPEAIIEKMRIFHLNREQKAINAKNLVTEANLLAEERHKHLNRREDEIRKSMRLRGLVVQDYDQFSAGLEEDEEDEFPELDDDAVEIIDTSLNASDDTKLIDKFNITIRPKDLKTLTGLTWLNDDVINFYMNLIAERGADESMPSVYVFNTYFYGKLMDKGHDGLRRWTKRVDIFDYDIVLAPLHIQGVHWCLAIIDNRKKEIQYYDSMGGRNEECLEALATYLSKEYKAKKNEDLDLCDWKRIRRDDIPQQQNGSDCGVFTCKFADYYCRDHEFTFTQDNMNYFRRRMMYEIVTGHLM